MAVKLAERTADLQRLQAEYSNYRKRVERDRVAVREHALANVVTELLPVLDNIGRAREHEELTGGFKGVADALESAASKLGLTTFGEAGDAFDPNVHEALMHSYSPDVTEPTCVQILQPGYKVGERILRPARVAVAEPSDPAGARTDRRHRGRRRPSDAADGRRGDDPGAMARPTDQQPIRRCLLSTKDFLEKDYYKALGVSKTASNDEIKKSYRKLARKYHPDANKGDAASEERFKEISEAYNTLSDSKKRAEYDEARSLFGGGARMPSGAGRPVRHLRPRGHLRLVRFGRAAR